MKTLPVGIQVYGLRDLLEGSPENFEEVMKKVKEMGYDGVELAGLYGLKPEYVRDVLVKIGLIPISAHVPLAELSTDAEKVAMDYKIVGCKYVAIAYLPEEYRHKTDNYDTVLLEIDRIGQIMKKHGITLLYHNHDFEFIILDNGIYGLDDIYSRVPASFLEAELDTCWIQVAGVDAASYMEKYLNRCPIVHLKDYIKVGNPKNMYKFFGVDPIEEEINSGTFEFCPIGFGQQLWDPILKATIKVGAKWVVVEQDEHYGKGSLETSRISREYLKLLGW